MLTNFLIFLFLMFASVGLSFPDFPCVGGAGFFGIVCCMLECFYWGLVT